MKKKRIIIPLIGGAIFIGAVSNGGVQAAREHLLLDQSASAQSAWKSTKSVATYGDMISFDGLEITFGKNIVWDAVSNEFSDHYGEDVVLIPVTIKNVSDETYGLNMFYFTQFGSRGTQLDSVSAFFDDEVTWAGNMRSGATQQSIMAFLYDGDGDYHIEFKTPSGRPTEVVLPIHKLVNRTRVIR